MQQQDNVVVVQQPTAQQTTIVQTQEKKVNHNLHFWITMVFTPWVFVWMHGPVLYLWMLNWTTSYS